MTGGPPESGAGPAEKLFAEYLRRRAETVGDALEFETFCAEQRDLAAPLRVLHSAYLGAQSLCECPSFAEIVEESLELAARPPPAVEKRYTVRREIGRGGMGVVLEVWDEQLGRPLAMKVLHGDGSNRDPAAPGACLVSRFLGEAHITGQLDHPGIVPLHEFGLDREGRAFFTMALVDGEDLRRVFAKTRDGTDGWSLTRALGVLVKVCEALSFAHSRGVIHRDLKPSNVMVGRFGQVYVMDWGLAKRAGANGKRASPSDGSARVIDASSWDSTGSSPELTLEGTVLGTPAYMPPEQAGGQVARVDERSDVYSVGAMLYTLLSGDVPYVARGPQLSSEEVLSAVLAGPPRSIHELGCHVPAELVAICEKAMARDPGDRYARMEDLADDLRAYLETRVVRAYRTGAVAEFRKWVARNRSAAAAIALLIAALAAFLGWREVTRSELEQERNQKSEALTKAERVLGEKNLALRQSEANRLIALSVAELSNDPTVALLLALEATALEPGCVADNALLAPLAEIREEKTLLGHDGWVYGADFSVDGRWVATAGNDRTVRIWDLATGEEIARYVAPEGLLNLQFGPDSTRVFTSGREGVYILDSSTCRELSRVRFSGSIGDFTVLPCKNLLLVASNGTITILDASTLVPLESVAVRPRNIFWLDVFADGTRALVGGSSADTSSFSNLVTTLWDLRDGQFLREFEGYYKAKFSPDGKVFVAGTTNTAAGATAHIVETESGTVRAVLQGHRAQIASGDFAPDGRLVATSSRDGTVRIWDVETGSTRAVLAAHQSDVMRVVFSDDGRRLVTGSHDRTVRVWETSPALTIDSLPDQLRVAAAMVSPDGKRALAWPGRDVEIWDAAARTRLLALGGHTSGVWSACFSRDGNRVASASWDGTARVWDAATGRPIVTLVGHRGRVHHATFDPEGERIVTASQDGSARVWSAKTGQQLVLLRGHGRDVNYAAFSENGTRVVTASHDGAAAVWDSSTGQRHWARKHHGSWVVFAGFFEDDRKVITGSQDNTACILDAGTGLLLQRLVGHEGRVAHADYHPRRGRVVTLSHDRTARVWDALSGRERLMIPAQDREFRFAAFSADGESVYTLSGCCTLQRWPIDPVPMASARKPRELTPEERSRFEIGSIEERAARRRAGMLERLRRDLALARRAHERLPDVWAVRDDYLERLKAGSKELAATRDTAELENVRQLVREQERDPGADWQVLVDVADALASAGEARDAVAALERAVRMPNAGNLAASRLALLRNDLLPDLPTCSSIDDALSASATIVAQGAAWRYFRGKQEPSEGLMWTEVAFDDSTWEEGASGFGYGDGDDATVLDDMPGAYTTVYTRRSLALADLEQYRSLVLSIRSDDGFVAYFNGREVGRAFAGSAGMRLPFDAVASGMAREPLVTHDIPLSRDLWRNENVISIQGLNHTADSSDLSLVATVHGELVAEVQVLERGGDLLEGLLRQPTSSEATGRVAYLEGRILQLLGNPAEALSRFEEAVRIDPTRPEPHLRTAECLRETRGPVAAEERLRAALAAGAGLGNAGEADLWNRWSQWSFVDLSRSAGDMLSIFPASPAPTGPGPALKALVESLAEHGSVRINCGGPRYVARDGAVWLADGFFINGYRFHGDRYSGVEGPFTGDIAETEDDPLYQTERWYPPGSHGGYAIPFPPGHYRLVLHFAEIYTPPDAGSQRIFDVTAEGRTLRSSYDLGAAGFATAARESWELEVKDGWLDIRLVARRGDPKVSAIEILAP